LSAPEIDVDELEAKLAGGAPLIDVRNRHEYVAAHVRGAMLMPLPDFVEYVDEVPTDDEVFVICATGARSARATEVLRSKGIDAYNVAGGTVAWVDSGREIVTGDEPG